MTRVSVLYHDVEEVNFDITARARCQYEEVARFVPSELLDASLSLKVLCRNQERATTGTWETSWLAMCQMC